MNKSKILTTLVAVGALVLTSAVTPAAARWAGGWHGGRPRRRDGPADGTAVGGAVPESQLASAPGWRWVPQQHRAATGTAIPITAPTDMTVGMAVAGATVRRPIADTGPGADGRPRPCSIWAGAGSDRPSLLERDPLKLNRIALQSV
jgi:hypothetical protein